VLYDFNFILIILITLDSGVPIPLIKDVSSLSFNVNKRVHEVARGQASWCVVNCGLIAVDAWACAYETRERERSRCNADCDTDRMPNRPLLAVAGARTFEGMSGVRKMLLK